MIETGLTKEQRYWKRNKARLAAYRLEYQRRIEVKVRAKKKRKPAKSGALPKTEGDM